jgi:hypothetical protein
MEDIFTSIQVYYKMMYDVNLQLSVINKAYHICYYNDYTIKGIIMELHLDEKVSRSYNFGVNEHSVKYFLTKNLQKYLCKRINIFFKIQEACL